jgi:hypothetical protein
MIVTFLLPPLVISRTLSKGTGDCHLFSLAQFRDTHYPSLLEVCFGGKDLTEMVASLARSPGT